MALSTDNSLRNQRPRGTDWNPPSKRLGWESILGLKSSVRVQLLHVSVLGGRPKVKRVRQRQPKAESGIVGWRPLP